MHFSPLIFAVYTLSHHVFLSYCLSPGVDIEPGAGRLLGTDSEYRADFPLDLSFLGRTDLLNLILTRSALENPTTTYLAPRATSSRKPSCPKCTTQKCQGTNQYREQKNCKCVPCPTDAKPAPDGTTCTCPQGKKMSDDGKSCVKDCPQGQQPSQDGKTCQKSCPQGQQPSSDGKTCQEACPDGQERSQDGKTCQKSCPQGQQPSSDGKTCQEACPDGQERSQDGGSCQKSCPQGKKLADDGKTCMDPCPDGQERDWVTGLCQKDCQPGFRPTPDNKSCEKDCGVGKVPSADGKSCVPDCKSGQVPNAAGTGCEDSQKEKAKQAKFPAAKDRYKNIWKNVRKARMGKCLTVVPLMMDVGGTFGLPEDDPFEWCDDWFNEDFVDNDDMMSYWDDDLTDIDWNVNMNDESDGGFLHKWTAEIEAQPVPDVYSGVCFCGVCNRGITEMRNLEKRELERRCPPRAKARDVVLRDTRLSTRQLPIPIIGDIIGIILEFLGDFISVGSRLASLAQAATRIATLIKRGEQFVSIARKGEKILSKGFDDMKDAAGKINKFDDGKLWKNCLRGKGPKG